MQVQDLKLNKTEKAFIQIGIANPQSMNYQAKSIQWNKNVVILSIIFNKTFRNKYL